MVLRLWCLVVAGSRMMKRQVRRMQAKKRRKAWRRMATAATTNCIQQPDNIVHHPLGDTTTQHQGHINLEKYPK